ncbi:MAG: hypothetical protein CM1200mP35_10580 [Chloroflexota bacterium]|nr:MAG: hypothetical protein CM1200mP35_10580 [Chloroflexota bacterium]
MVQLRGDAKQRYVADMFSSISQRYDLMNNLMTMGMHRKWKLQTANITATGLSGFALDIASGTGDLALELGKIPELTTVIGLDLIPEMVDLARIKIIRRVRMVKPAWSWESSFFAIPRRHIFLCHCRI